MISLQTNATQNRRTVAMDAKDNISATVSDETMFDAKGTFLHAFSMAGKHTLCEYCSDESVGAIPC